MIKKNPANAGFFYHFYNLFISDRDFGHHEREMIHS